MRWLHFFLAGLLASSVAAVEKTGEPSTAARVKDLAALAGVRDNQLMGYGLVVGLAGTGDRRQTIFSAQSLTNMLERTAGIIVSPNAIRVTNMAAVMVTATLPPFAQPGMKIDITASAIGDASSLQGGILLITSLKGVDGQIYGVGQGPLALGGFLASQLGTSRALNHPTVGRVPNGATVERPAPAVSFGNQLRWQLHRTDFTTAVRLAQSINQLFPAPAPLAQALDGNNVTVQIPAEFRAQPASFIAAMESLRIELDTAARVVINERTGTIVIGNNVVIHPVSLMHGSLIVEVQTNYLVSQPAPLSRQGSTEIVPQVSVNVAEEKAKNLTLPSGTTVEKLVRALTSIGATPRDVIAILQNLKSAGALVAEVEVI